MTATTVTTHAYVHSHSHPHSHSHSGGRLANDRTRSILITGGFNGVGGRSYHGPGIARHQRLHHTRSARFATNPAAQIPLERIEQYSRFRSTPSVNQLQAAQRSNNQLELRPLTTRAEGSNSISSGSDIPTSQHQRPSNMTATKSAPQLLTAERRMAGAIEGTPQSSNSSRRLSFTLTRTGTRHSDRTGRRLSTTSSHATTHSWHGSSGILANLPTPGMLASLAGGAHYTGNPKYSKQEAVRASFGSKNVILEGKRKQTVEDVLELFCAHPSLEIFDRSWHPNAVFESTQDPLTKCVGYKEYAAQWYGLPRIAARSTTLEYRVLSSTHYPHKIVFDQTQQYTLRYIKRKKTIHSLIVLELDEDGKIIKMEDRWNGEEPPRNWGAIWLRRLNGKTAPFFVRVPRRTPERTPTPKIMSDDNDLSDELLALAGDSEDQPRRRKRSSSSQHKSSSKRRKQEAEDEYADDPESEEDEANPYPLEGKYADELDRQRLLEMPETEREDILSQRMEEMQRFQDKVNLDRMLKAQRGSPDASSDPVAKAAKRKHTSIGVTKEKSKGLEQLKEKRRAKQDNMSRRTRTSDDSPVKRRSSSPESDSSDEEGQFRPGDESFDNSTPRQKKEEKEEPPTIDDFNAARLTREQLAKFCHVTWFQELVQGAYVRYLIGGDEHGAPVYRVCEIVDLGADLVKPYTFEGQITDQVLELRHGKDTKLFPMDRVSNSPFTDREVDRLIRICQADGLKPPTKSRLEKKSQRLQQLTSQRFTDNDITKMMERKAALKQQPSHAQLLQEKSRLNQARNLAISRRDAAEVAELDVKIAELEVLAVGVTRDQEEDQWAKVNERNRRLNLEQTKRAEALAAAKRKALMASRSSTPKTGTPGAKPEPKAATNLSAPPEKVTPAAPQTTFDAMVQSVSIDIDF
ncbi:RNA polymerase II C-terminal domain phosphoserine binding [Rhizoctonia solani]|uniref:RNA polymerase II C-terminal domain phosphoserine binding n=1 Tax=Rhizoctonia solani TaxID=456999 RepID=A0A8H7H786_9AGAM|nr:RNA polymerase II C-terminal domain phosphoserine binding [Rhizoctonia solani]